MRAGPSLKGLRFDAVQTCEPYHPKMFNMRILAGQWGGENWARILLRSPSDNVVNEERWFDRLAHLSQITTANGQSGVGARHYLPGDLVCIFNGGNVPYILREVQNTYPAQYLFVGEAYIDGAMHGEIMDELIMVCAVCECSSWLDAGSFLMFIALSWSK